LLEAPRERLVDWLDFKPYWDGLPQATRSWLDRRKLPPDVLQAIGGRTVEAVPYSIDLIRANGLDWRPRPMIQTLTAYTPTLDSLNAAHVASERSASRVLLEYAPVDGRHPFLEDPLSMRTLVDYYDCILVEENVAVLTRRSSRRFGPEAKLRETTAIWGEWTDVPDVPAETRRMVGVHIRPSPWGRVRTFALRLAPVFIEARFAGGRRRTARVVPYTLVNGALFESMPENLAEVSRSFGEPGPDLDPIVGLRFYTPFPSEFESSLRITWSYVPQTK
jgi:hypothetical protein